MTTRLYKNNKSRSSSAMSTFLVASVTATLCVFLFVYNAYADNENIETILIDGYGTDIPEAAQNAAQNALVKVVGSFVESNKTLDKQVEIREGVRSQVKSITTNVKEYSQGTIKSFDIVSVGEENGLKKVTAKVDVRTEEFKSYIGNIIGGEAKVDGTSLFAQAATKSKQYNNKISILSDSLLSPLVVGEIINFSISKPSAYDSHSGLAGLYEIKEMAKRYGGENIYIFDVMASINDDYMKNAKNSIQSISRAAYNVNSSIKLVNDGYGGITQTLQSLGAGQDDFYVIIHDGESEDIVTAWQKSHKDFSSSWSDNIKSFPSDIYIVSDSLSRLGESNGLGVSFTKYPGPPVSNLKAVLLGDDDTVLQESLVNSDSYNAVALPDDYIAAGGFKYAWQMYVSSYSNVISSYYCGVGIVKKRKFKLVMAINQGDLKKTQKILLKLEKQAGLY